MSIEKSQQLFGQLSEVDKAKFNFDAVEVKIVNFFLFVYDFNGFFANTDRSGRNQNETI